MRDRAFKLGLFLFLLPVLFAVPPIRPIIPIAPALRINYINHINHIHHINHPEMRQNNAISVSLKFFIKKRHGKACGRNKTALTLHSQNGKGGNAGTDERKRTMT